MATTKRGLDCKLFYGVAGSQGATELTNCKDLTLSLEVEEIDATTRAAQGWDVIETGLKRGTLDFQMVYDTDDPGFVTVEDAFINGTALAFFVTRGDGKGLDADFKIIKFSEGQPLRGLVAMDVSIRPSRSTRAPAYVH